MTGRAGKRKGFGWIAAMMHACNRDELLKHWRDSQMQTHIRSQNPKRRDNKRARRRGKRDLGQ
jgi:hypothetical protein